MTTDTAQPEREVWQCDCGSVTFLICSTQEAFCSQCGVEAARMRGYWKIRGISEETETPPNSSNVSRVQ